MKKPNPPKKIIAPIQPKMFLNPTHHRLEVCDGDSLKNMIDAIDDANVEDVLFEKEYGFSEYDDESYYLTWTDKEGTLNPKYQKQLDKYEIDMVKYETDMMVYEEKVKKYKADLNEYLLWYHEKELKKLKK